MSTTPPGSKLKLYTHYAVAYTSWITSFLLWFWFIIIGRDALSGVLNVYYIQNKLSRRYISQFYDRIFLIVSAVIWITLVVVVEEYLRRGIKKGDLFRRLGRVFAPIILCIFIADATNGFLLGFQYLPWIRWLLLIIELAGIIGFSWLATKGPVSVKLKQTA